MASLWQYTDDTHLIVQRTADNGGTESTLVSNLPEGTEVLDPPQLSFEDYVAAFTPGLQQWMEATAQDNAYDSVLSCISYLNDGVAQFAADALAMKNWRSALWRWASEYQAGQHGQLPNPLPTLAEIVALAPQPADFGWVVHPKGVIISAQLPPENPSA